MKKDKKYEIEVKLKLNVVMSGEKNLEEAMKEFDKNISSSDLICVNGCITKGKVEDYQIKKNKQ